MAESRINDAREFLNLLADLPIKLPFDPTLLPTLFTSMSDSSRISLQDLAALVARSQALSVKVLSVANSACYGLINTVTTLERGVQVLGLRDLRSLVMMFGLSEAIPHRALPKDFPTRHLWEHQMRVAKTGRLITMLIGNAQRNTPGLPDPESVYAAGILHDIGKVILAYLRPADWQNITVIQNEKRLNIAQAEDEYWGLDHGSIGGIVLKNWSLPDILTYMVSWHHHPQFVTDHQLAVRILSAANVLSVTPLKPVEALSAEQANNLDKAFPPELFSILPGYEKFFAAHYAEFVRVLDDRHTTAFVGAF